MHFGSHGQYFWRTITLLLNSSTLFILINVGAVFISKKERISPSTSLFAFVRVFCDFILVMLTIFVRYWLMCKAQRAHCIRRLIEQRVPGPSSRCDHILDSFCLFSQNYRELANSFLTLCDRSGGSSNPPLFEQGLSDLAT